ncbi:hypothetical protein [Candidatus Marithrix sp. Canyon 246]|uniref:hypothetical protein n=1 Tax=Candidatus Marithrix sp. Canyon 246 TaxID=1827136 RepID=UPI000849EDB4|nr:hypothetical protein [Candidatus Marithrix sp. Canyon 246]
MVYKNFNKSKQSLRGSVLAQSLTIVGVLCVLIGGGLTAFFGFQNHTETPVISTPQVNETVIETQQKPTEPEIKEIETIVAKPESVVVIAPKPIEPPALTEQQIQAKAKIARLLAQCQENLDAKRLTSSRTGKTALSCYKDVLALEADNEDAVQGLKNIEEVYLGLAEKAFKRNKLNKVKTYMASIEKVDPESTILADLKQRVETARLLPRCKRYLDNRSLTSGKRGTALSCYQKVLELDAENETAHVGLQTIEQLYIDWAKIELENKRLSKVKNYIASIEKVNPQSTALVELKQLLADAEQ